MNARPLATSLGAAACSIALTGGLLGTASPAMAWGSTGHRLVSGAAAATLPDTLPAFLRTPETVAFIEYLGPEPDKSKGAGQPFDADMDPGHYLDYGDDGKVGGVVDLNALPKSRQAYDTALRAAGAGNEYSLGYLPYSIVDGWRHLANDFALWRADKVGEVKSGTPEDRAWFALDRQRRESIAIEDLGFWSHFVGDASQPLHVSIHYNGWGDYPNPQGFTMSHETHAHFEGEFVRDNVTLAAVEAAMTPVRDCGCTIEQFVAQYLAKTNSYVVPFYTLEKQGAFETPTPAGVAFTTARVADGASALRDLVVSAYAASATFQAGFPDPHTVDDYESGRAVPQRKFVGGGD